MENSRREGYSARRMVESGLEGNRVPAAFGDGEKNSLETEEVEVEGERLVYSISFERINRKIWWTGFRLGVVRAHDKTMLSVAWDGPEIWKRFKDWKPDG